MGVAGTVAQTAVLRASVRRHRRAQGDRSTLRSIRPKRAPERPSSPARPRSRSATDAPSEQRESNQLAGSGAAPGSATVTYVEGSNARRPSTPDGAGLEFSAGAGDRFPAVVP